MIKTIFVFCMQLYMTLSDYEDYKDFMYNKLKILRESENQW